MPKSIPCREEILSEDYRDFIVSDVQMPYLNSLLPETYCSQESGVGYRLHIFPKNRLNLSPWNGFRIFQFQNVMDF